jgi:hypothetical protein
LRLAALVQSVVISQQLAAGSLDDWLLHTGNW